MRKFSVPCDFGGIAGPFEVYIGRPAPGDHPLQWQKAWLEQARGGTVPVRVMDSFAMLLTLADKNKVSFEELCAYALEAGKDELEEQAKS